MKSLLKRGDVVWVNLEPVKGSETGKTRTCVVIQNDVGNKYSPATIIAVITEYNAHLGACYLILDFIKHRLESLL